MKETNIRFLPNNKPEQIIADIVNLDGSFKFRDYVTKEERLTILSWLESQGVKIVVK